MRKTMYVVYLSLIFGAFQNCSPTHFESATGGRSAASVADQVPAEEVAQKFASTLQPILRANCAVCHGQAQVPKFAVLDPLVAVTTIQQNNLVNLDDAAASRFVAKILSGHNGFTATLAQQVQDGIQAWSDALSSQPAPVDTAAPAVMISAPSAGATLSGAVNIAAVATDDKAVVGVQFYVNNAASGPEITSAPYSVTISSLPDGAYTVSARARDAAGNIGTSANVNFTIVTPVADTTAPTVSITAPLQGANVSATVNVTAMASDNIGIVGVTLLVDGVVYGAEDLTAPYSIPLNTVGLTNGAHVLTARARDAAGNMTTSSPRNIMVSNAAPDTTAPTVAITAPLAATAVTGNVTITANAMDNVGVVGVQFFVNGTASGVEDTTAPYSTVWTTMGLASGNYVLTARARDAAGNMTTSGAVTVSFTAVNPMATFTYISQNILPKCTNCHGANVASAGVRYNNYTETLRTVRANNLNGSKLYTETANGSMPIGAGALSATELRAIADWINAGALNN